MINNLININKTTNYTKINTNKQYSTNFTRNYDENTYKKYFNLIYEFINQNIIPNSPFVKCHISQNNDPCEMVEWEFYLENDGKYTFKELIPIYREALHKIVKFCKDNNCLYVFNRIALIF